MTLLVILVAAAAFLIYIGLSMYYGRDARIEMFWTSIFILVAAVGLGVLLWISLDGGERSATTAAIASLAGLLALFVRYLAVEFQRK